MPCSLFRIRCENTPTWRCIGIITLKAVLYIGEGFFKKYLAICSELCYNDAESLLMLTLGREDVSRFAPPQGIAVKQQNEAAQLK